MKTGNPTHFFANAVLYVINISSLITTYSFQGIPVLAGWLVVSQETEMVGSKKKTTTYTWNARTPHDCIKDLITLCKDLITLCKELQIDLQARFRNIVLSSVKKLCKVFHLENIAKQMCNFKVYHGKLVVNVNIMHLLVNTL